jgi:hypothetical protein
LVQQCFIKKNGQRRYKYLVPGKDRSYFIEKTLWSYQKFSETDIINMLEFFLLTTHLLCLVYSRHTYRYKLGSSSRRLNTYETDFIQSLLKKNEKKLARSFNFTFRYIDDVLSLNNSRICDFVDRIYLIEVEIKDTTDTDRSASYLDLHLKIDSEGRLRTKLYDKRDDFNFPIVTFSFICSNIQVAPAYWVCISQLIRYSRACGCYQDFIDRGLLLTRKLLNQGFLLVKLKSSPRIFYGRHHDLVDRYEISVTQMNTDTFHL